mmetsp:Transcript_30257/g.55458  ORF Transcript_30257/g.55458 Transcript_30257/m.55458 type:complete len:725 (+) Transcript_30257:68-2242(+)
MALDLDSPSPLELSPLHLRVLNFLGEKVDATSDSVCKSLKWNCAGPATSVHSPRDGESDSTRKPGCNASPLLSSLQRPDLDNTLGNVLLDVFQNREEVQDVDAEWEMQTLRCAEPEQGLHQRCSATGKAKAPGLNRALPSALLGVPSPSRAACGKGACRFMPASKLQPASGAEAHADLRPEQRPHTPPSCNVSMLAGYDVCVDLRQEQRPRTPPSCNVSIFAEQKPRTPLSCNVSMLAGHDVCVDLHQEQRLDEYQVEHPALASSVSLAVGDSAIGFHLDSQACASSDLVGDGCAIELRTLRPYSWVADQMRVKDTLEKSALPQQVSALPARYANATLVEEKQDDAMNSIISCCEEQAHSGEESSVNEQWLSVAGAGLQPDVAVDFGAVAGEPAPAQPPQPHVLVSWSEDEDVAAAAVLPTPPPLPSTPVSWSEAVALCAKAKTEKSQDVELLKECRRGGLEVFIESPRINHVRQQRLQAEWKKQQQFLHHQRAPGLNQRRHSIAGDPGSVSSIAGQVRGPRSLPQSRDTTPVRGFPGLKNSTSRQSPAGNGRSESIQIDATRAPASARSDRSVFGVARRRASVGSVNLSSLGTAHMQSNRKLIRNALERHCLKGEAARSQREQLLQAFDREFSTYERFVILFRNVHTGRRDFRALYAYSEGAWIRLMQSLPSPARLDERMVAQFLRYDSSCKEFKEVPALQELHVADAAFLQARYQSKSRVVV